MLRVTTDELSLRHRINELHVCICAAPLASLHTLGTRVCEGHMQVVSAPSPATLHPLLSLPPPQPPGCLLHPPTPPCCLIHPPHLLSTLLSGSPGPPGAGCRMRCARRPPTVRPAMSHHTQHHTPSHSGSSDAEDQQQYTHICIRIYYIRMYIFAWQACMLFITVKTHASQVKNIYSRIYVYMYVKL